MRRFVERLESVLAHRAAGWVLVLLVGVAFVAGHFLHPLYPGDGPDAVTRGWWTWNDQQRYLAEAAAIATGTLDAKTFAYPVGYPALGALLWRWMPADPFFVPDLLLVLAAAAVWWRLAVRWLSRLEALLVALLFVATHRWLIAYSIVVPWNTLPTQAALLAGIWLATAGSGPRSLWGLSLLAAGAYVVRPIDAVAFGPLLVFATLRLRTWRERLQHGAGGLAVIALAVAAVGWVHVVAFGTWRSPYEAASTQVIGFFAYPVSYKLHWLFVDGQPVFREIEPALLFRYPWLFLAIPGIAFWLQRERVAAVAGLSALVVNWGLYINYNDLLPSDIYRFTLIHYLAWAFPLLFVLAIAACRHGWRSAWVRAGFAAAAVLFVGSIGLRQEERPLPVERGADGAWRLPEQRPLLVRFPGVPVAHSGDVRLDGRPLIECSQFVMPYVPSDLQLLLGTRTSGASLSVVGPTATLAQQFEASVYVWRWRPDLDRVSQISR